MADWPSRTIEYDGPYPEQSDVLEGRGRWSRESRRVRSKQVLRFMERVDFHGRTLARARVETLSRMAAELRPAVFAHGIDEDRAAHAFAIIRKVASETVGLWHHDEQVLGAWGLLRGMVAEMETGEGKTLTATLAAGTAALAGIHVHVVTSNDYLARRDAESMGPIYRALGLRVGVIERSSGHHERREAYGADVTYCTGSELVFDYLRDRISLGGRDGRLRSRVDLLASGRNHTGLLLRGLQYAIVDELDNILIDEARTPLVISGADISSDEDSIYAQAKEICEQLSFEVDFDVDAKDRTVKWTEEGRGRLETLIVSAGYRSGVWSRPRVREEIVRQALVARHLFERDRHYIVESGRVQIVDEYTGRSMPDRSWELGIHQAIEAKEGCPITPRNRPLARISYQRFFRRFLHVAGMTGTANGIERELEKVYGRSVLRVPTHRPVRRKDEGIRVFATEEAKWQAVVDRVRDLTGTGRPVLIGTRSVEASERLSRSLERSGLAHQLLNARQDREEAEIIRRAGELGRIMVATNMAGRGTDIRLSREVAALGGLHVIATEIHEARRIDRQLFGRCGRQGDPGSYEAIVSLEDELVSRYVSESTRSAALRWLARGRVELVTRLFRKAQRSAERRHHRERRDLLRLDLELAEALSFAGASVRGGLNVVGSLSNGTRDAVPRGNGKEDES